jgi:hypothetical protein
MSVTEIAQERASGSSAAGARTLAGRSSLTVAGAFMAMLDGAIDNVAIPSIREDSHVARCDKAVRVLPSRTSISTSISFCSRPTALGRR